MTIFPPIISENISGRMKPKIGYNQPIFSKYAAGPGIVKGKKCSFHSWRVYANTQMMQSGVDEVTLRHDLRVDVLVENTDLNKSLAIEVFVTHKKDDYDLTKFHDVQQDSIEIDISGLAWNANKETIKKAMLAGAPRKWLFCNETENLKNSTEENLNYLVEEKNSLYHNKRRIIKRRPRVKSITT